jgi:hypothetical protein
MNIGKPFRIMEELNGPASMYSTARHLKLAQGHSAARCRTELTRPTWGDKILQRFTRARHASKPTVPLPTTVAAGPETAVHRPRFRPRPTHMGRHCSPYPLPQPSMKKGHFLLFARTRSIACLCSSPRHVVRPTSCRPPPAAAGRRR